MYNYEIHVYFNDGIKIYTVERKEPFEIGEVIDLDYRQGSLQFGVLCTLVEFLTNNTIKATPVSHYTVYATSCRNEMF
jgi:hypothetical protein